MSKTAKEWLEIARADGADWVNEAVKNIALQPNHPARRKFYENLGLVIFYEFAWRETPEKWEYWEKIHENNALTPIGQNLALFCAAHKTKTVTITSGDCSIDLLIGEDKLLDLATILGLNSKNTAGTEAEHPYAYCCLNYKINEQAHKQSTPPAFNTPYRAG